MADWVPLPLRALWHRFLRWLTLEDDVIFSVKQKRSIEDPWSTSNLHTDGRVTVELAGPLRVGEQNELSVLVSLEGGLRAVGHAAKVVMLAAKERRKLNERGEDGRILIDGEQVPVQVVTFPVGQQPWKDLSTTGEAKYSGAPGEPLQWLRQALLHKRDKAVGALLAVDARHFAAAVYKLDEQYLASYPDPLDKFKFYEVWVVGSGSPESTFRVGRRR